MVIGYFEKQKLALLIVENIKQNFVGHENYKPYKEIKKLHGLLERNLKIVEVEGGFEIYVPMAYGEQYVATCIRMAIKEWKQELAIKAGVKDSASKKRGKK